MLVMAFLFVLSAAPAVCEEGGAAGLTANIAYYPSHNRLELRTGDILFHTDDGEVGLRGEYFDNPALEGQPVFTRVDRRIRFNWRNRRPHKSMPDENYSVRWTGRLASVPWDGPFLFRFAHDDVLRVWIDGKRIYSRDRVPPGRHRMEKVVQVEADARPRIRIECRDQGGGAEVRVGVRPVGKRCETLYKTPDGQEGLRAEYFEGPGFDTDVKKTVVRKTVRHNDRGGVWVRFSGTFGPALKSGDYIFKFQNRDAVRLWLDGKKVLDLTDPPHGGPHGSVTRVRYHLDEGETVPIRVELERPRGSIPYDTHMIPRMTLSTQRDLSTSGRLGIIDEAEKTIQAQSLPFDRFGDRTLADIRPLEPGMYTVRLTGRAYSNAAETKILEQDFAWEGNDLGITDKIYPPFEPIKREGQTVEVVLRRYELGGLGLPAQIEARGQDPDTRYKPLLARPIALKANGGSIDAGKGRFTHTGEREMVYEGTVSHPAVTVATRVRTEFDGCMRVEMTLKPGTEKKELRNLTLDVPIKDPMAPLVHVVKGTPPIRNNPAGKTWGGTGRVWASTQMGDNWPGNFKPYIWLGGAARGLSWFADNERGWVMDWRDNPPCQTLHRENGILTLRMHLVQEPITLKEPRTIVFGLMASPAKPMPENWRRIGRPEAKKIKFLMGHWFGLNGTFNAKYPRNKDWSPLEKFHQARRGQDVDARAFVKEWAERNLHDEVSEKLKRRMRNLVRLGVRSGRNLGSDTLFTAYVEEFRATSIWHEEMKTYWSEWTRKFETPPLEQLTGPWENFPTKPGHLHWRRPTGAAVPSYRDFMCYIASKWLNNGAGIYFDNTFMQEAFNLVNTSAYVRSDGRIQPSAQIWARRKYLRRIWNLHRELYQPDAPQIMMLHMTNSHVVPYMVWNQANMDLEWMMPGAKPFQTKFSPAVLRTETLGRKTGNHPMAMITVGKGGRPTGMSKEEYRRLERTCRDGLLVHEIRWTPSLNTRRLPKPFVDFGYGLEDCDVWNYWQDNPPVQVDDPECKWLLLRRDGQLMILFVTWNDKAERVEVEVDTDALEVDVKRAVDTDSGETMEVVDGDFAFSMSGYGTRIYRLE